MHSPNYPTGGVDNDRQTIVRTAASDRQSTARLRDWLPSDRYCVVLAVIPLSDALAVFGHAVAGLGLHLALLPASLIGAVLMVDVVYLNPPTGRGSVVEDDGDVGHAQGDGRGGVGSKAN